MPYPVDYFKTFFTCRKLRRVFLPMKVTEVNVMTTTRAKMAAYSTVVGPSSDRKKFVNQRKRGEAGIGIPRRLGQKKLSRYRKILQRRVSSDCRG